MCLNVQVDFRNLTGPIKMDMLKRFIRSLKKEETVYEPKRLEFDDNKKPRRLAVRVGQSRDVKNCAVVFNKIEQYETYTLLRKASMYVDEPLDHLKGKISLLKALEFYLLAAVPSGEECVPELSSKDGRFNVTGYSNRVYAYFFYKDLPEGRVPLSTCFTAYWKFNWLLNLANFNTQNEIYLRGKSEPKPREKVVADLLFTLGLLGLKPTDTAHISDGVIGTYAYRRYTGSIPELGISNIMFVFDENYNCEFFAMTCESFTDMMKMETFTKGMLDSTPVTYDFLCTLFQEPDFLKKKIENLRVPHQVSLPVTKE